jgi:uncharacterized protein YprB with RNaseH-like and TPR domain
LFNHRCKHYHRYIEHLPCFEEEKPPQNTISEKVGHLDIESSNLKANYGIIFSYAIKDKDGNLFGRSLTPHEIRSGIYDKTLLTECIADMRKFDLLSVFFGEYFDLPTIRTRALYYRLDFPLYKEIKIIDVWKIARKKLNLHSNRLEVICDFYGIPAKTHPMKPDIWVKALSGNQEALSFIWEHNKEDVLSLEAVYNLLINYVGKSNRSI